MLDLRVRRGCEHATLAGDLRPSADVSVAVVDLVDLTWTTPFGLVAISAFVDGARRDGREVDFRAPEDASRSRYLTRMGLGDLLEGMNVEHDLQAARKLSRGANLVELQRFHSVEEVEELAEHVEGALGSSRAAEAKALTIGIYEAGANVPSHAGVNSGFLAAQQTHEGKRLSFAVGDAGMGFLGALRRQGARSAEDAIDMALDGVSSSRGRPYGRGLQEMAREISSMSGTMSIVTGDASWSRTGNARPYWRDLPGVFGGSLIEGSFRLR